MTRRQTSQFVSFAALAVLLAGCAGADRARPAPAPSSPVVAEFAGQQLTLAEFEERYAQSAGSRQAAAGDSLEAYEDFLERYVNFRLKVNEARRMGLDNDPQIQEEIAGYRDQVALPYLLEREVFEEIVRDLYEKQQEEIAASHVLIAVDRNAPPADTLAAYRRLESIRDSIVTAHLDFATAAVRHSDDPSRTRNQGSLGYFTGGRMIEAFEEQAYATPVGGISPVFRTQFGYHILEVSDRRPAAGEIRASHILLLLPPNASPADSAEVYTRIEALRERLAAGEDFASLAREHSEDPGSAERGGDLGHFTRDRMVAPFAEAAYNLREVGDLSDVVRTQFGVHLILLTDRKPLPSYSERYNDLKRLAEQLPRTHDRRQEVGRSFRTEHGSPLDTALVRRAAAAYSPGSLFTDLQADRFGVYADSVLATIDGTPITFREFAEELQGARIPPSEDQRSQLVTFLDLYLDERAVALAARRLEDRDPAFQRLISEFADGVLLFRLSEDEVWGAASQDTLALRTYFDRHADRYRFPDRQRVVAFFSRSDSLLTETGRLLDRGTPPAEIIAQLSPEGGSALRADTLHLAEPSGSVFDRALDLSPGERSGIISDRGQRIVLFHAGVEPARTMRFEEARSRLVSDYQDYLEARLVERLREAAHVRLYPEHLHMAFEGDAAASF